MFIRYDALYRIMYRVVKYRHELNSLMPQVATSTEKLANPASSCHVVVIIAIVLPVNPLEIKLIIAEAHHRSVPALLMDMGRISGVGI